MSAAEQHKRAQTMYTENQTLRHYCYRSTLKTQFLTFLKVKEKIELYWLFLHLICLKYIVISAFSSCVSAASQVQGFQYFTVWTNYVLFCCTEISVVLEWDDPKGHLTNLKCKYLFIYRQSLGREETRALVQAMESGVEDITLGGGVTLDMETLAEFSGQKMCKEVALQRYSGQIQ